MQIARVEATLHRVPVEVPLLPQRRVGVVVVRVESDEGLVGFGVAGGGFQTSRVDLLNREIGPFLVGRDALAAEQVAYAAEQRFNSRGMTGLVSCALSGVDIALWDMRGKALGQPTWRLLGGFSAVVPAYLTFGLPEYDLDQLEEAARLAVARGYARLKMVVARAPVSGLSDDVERVTRVREAVGPHVRLMIDANEGLDLLSAVELARRLEPLDVAWFEEPVHGNDAGLLAELRRRTTMPIAGGQFEGHRFRLRDLMLASAVDIVQTNVLFVGGYTEALKVAHFADVLRLPIANGGGWAHHNAPLMAAVANGHGVEMHAWQWTLAETLYAEPPVASGGALTLSEAPGLGLEPRQEVLRETRVSAP
jgi:L-alanine-DL-glutamate epimerase-like enolase superfamily enzyme